VINYNRRNILIIAEGLEEKIYLDKLLYFPNINKDAYCFNAVVNSKGSGNIKARYQYALQNGYYDAILIFCDADRISDDFVHLLSDIGEFFENKEDAIKVFIFANPVTLQIVLSHFGDASLASSGKKTNAPIVKALTGICNYDAKEEQIKEMINLIHYDSLSDFKRRLGKISTDMKDVPSTNFLLFLNRFEGDDTSWVDEIKASLIKG
jgi:hypothetical protein